MAMRPAVILFSTSNFYFSEFNLQKINNKAHIVYFTHDINTLHSESAILTGMLWSFLPLCEEATYAKYWMTFLVFSVLPAPDSPLQYNES